MDHHETLETAKVAIEDTLQSVYGDSSQTTLDRQAAVEVVKTLERLGWMDPYTIRAVVAAAGGKVTLSDDLLMSPPAELMVQRSEADLSVVLSTIATES